MSMYYLNRGPSRHKPDSSEEDSENLGSINTQVIDEAMDINEFAQYTRNEHPGNSNS